MRLHWFALLLVISYSGICQDSTDTNSAKKSKPSFLSNLYLELNTLATGSAFGSDIESGLSIQYGLGYQFKSIQLSLIYSEFNILSYTREKFYKPDRIETNPNIAYNQFKNRHYGNRFGLALKTPLIQISGFSLLTEFELGIILNYSVDQVSYQQIDGNEDITIVSDFVVENSIRWYANPGLQFNYALLSWLTVSSNMNLQYFNENFNTNNQSYHYFIPNVGIGLQLNPFKK